MEEKRYKGTGPTYEELAKAVKETTGGDLTPEMAKEITNRDMSEISDAWRNMATSERLPLETFYATSGDKEQAINDVLKKWDTEFGMPRKVVEYSTDRDVYNALKEVYDNTGDWDMVYKVAKYNNVPKETMDKFVKNGKWTDYSVGDELGSGAGAVGRGATGNLYGGIENILSGGDYAGKYTDVVPQGVEYDDMANTLWRAGINQARNYGRSLMETDPGMEIAGQVVGMFAPVGLASKLTKGLNVSAGATRLGRALNTATRGAATGALASIPSSLAEDSLIGALGNTAKTAGEFAAGDLAFQGLGAALGGTRRAVSNLSRRASTVPENYVRAFEKIKPVSEMTEQELARGAERGWLKDGKLNVTKYLADEYGMAGIDTMEDLFRVAKNNREVFNQLKNELKDFGYKEAITKASANAMIPNAPLSRVNQVLKSIPERLEKFSDDILGYTGADGGRIADSMKDFNQDIKHALREIKNPNSVEKRAIDQYLKEIESANMLQFMKKMMPTEFQAIDKNKTLLGELARIFNITNPISAARATDIALQSRITRNYMRQVMAGEKRKAESTVQKLLNKTSKATGRTPSSSTIDSLNNLQRMLLLYGSNKD